MKVKIESDGTLRGTRVNLPDTGQELERLLSIEWSVDWANAGPVRCSILFSALPCMIECDADFQCITLAGERFALVPVDDNGEIIEQAAEAAGGDDV